MNQYREEDDQHPGHDQLDPAKRETEEGRDEKERRLNRHRDPKEAKGDHFPHIAPLRPDRGGGATAYLRFRASHMTPGRHRSDIETWTIVDGGDARLLCRQSVTYDAANLRFEVTDLARLVYPRRDD
jgi:hypothetical protein